MHCVYACPASTMVSFSSMKKVLSEDEEGWGQGGETTDDEEGTDRIRRCRRGGC